MELDYYFFKTKQTQRSMAKKLGIAGHTLSNYVTKKRCPDLFMAIKIHLETEGKVSLMELLLPEQLEELNNSYSLIKKIEL